ncbi:MAG: dihydroorotate dehydrogenase electron transfer subunit [Oscillospiraceae bacterium]|jgi:dihydroorotate dehydrogenase electron transfer subunit|nr:dihydroorotate dehydrogenase electron transfer subunit [Oscillospiraceae bacterium]
MKKQDFLKVISNNLIAKNIFKMCLVCGCDLEFIPGQFLNIKIDGFYLRRPMSICDFENGIITIVYKIVGKGTEALSKISKGNKLDVIFPLGNGFDIKKSYDNITIIGGGVGLAPLYFLFKTLKKMNKKVIVYAGFRTLSEIFFEEEFSSIGEFIISTQDGTKGNKGLIIDILDKDCDYYFTCGPALMMESVRKILGQNGQFLLEERMACGFGACMSCVCKTKFGAKRVCKEGPVFFANEF